MAHWLLMFRPETWTKVQEHGLIGVNGNQHKRIAQIAAGDTFVAYVSRERILDGAGVFTSAAFTDLTPVFGVREVYPYRARVRFDTVGAKRDAKVALWGLDEFANGAKTTPSNMLLCRGGFMRITPADREYLLNVLDGTWRSPTPLLNGG